MPIKKVIKGYNDLATLFPELAAQWDYEANNGFGPDMITYGSGKEVAWKCDKCGYKWKQTINSRTAERKKNFRCPCCVGNKAVKKGYNDLATLNPEIAAQWDYDKNGDLTPDSVRRYSHKKVWWKCNVCNYSWFKAIAWRKNDNCPACTGNVAIEGKNDLATLHPELMTQWDYDKNGDLIPDKLKSGSHKKAWWTCEICGHSWKSEIRTKCQSKCPVCSGRVAKSGYNDLATLYPDIAAEWDYEKNGDLTPDSIRVGISKKVYWKCSICGNGWSAEVKNRKDGTGCPYCAGRAVKKGYNDLETLHPELIEEWDYEKNGDLTPDSVTVGSNKTVGWKCRICNYEWDAIVEQRAIGHSGCPVCNGRAVKKGYNDLETLYPDIAKNWDYDKNGELTPDMFRSGSLQKVWWKKTIEGKEVSWKRSISVEVYISYKPAVSKIRRKSRLI